MSFVYDPNRVVLREVSFALPCLCFRPPCVCDNPDTDVRGPGLGAARGAGGSAVSPDGRPAPSVLPEERGWRQILDDAFSGFGVGFRATNPAAALVLPDRPPVGSLPQSPAADALARGQLTGGALALALGAGALLYFAMR